MNAELIKRLAELICEECYFDFPPCFSKAACEHILSEELGPLLEDYENCRRLLARTSQEESS